MGFIFFFLILAFGFVWYLGSVFRYVFFALLIVYIMNPFVKYLMTFGVKEKPAYAFVICLLLLLVVGSIYFLGPNLMKEADNAQKAWPKIEERVNAQLFREVYSSDGQLSSYYLPFIKLEVQASTVKGWFTKFTSQMKTVLGGLLPVLLSSLILVPLFTVILIKDRRKMFRNMFNFVPNRYFEVVMSMAYEIHKSVENWVSAKVIQSVIVAGVCMIGFLVFGVKFPLLFGMMAGLFNIIPYIGPILGAVPPIAISYLLLDTRTAIFALIVIVVGQLVDNLFTQPVLLPKLVKEQPLAVILVTLIGAELFGAIGLVLALVVYAVFKIVLIKSYQALDVIYSRKDSANAFSEQISLRYF